MLTNTEVKNAKPGAAVIKMFDGGGLHLRIPTTGSKLWRMAYRFNGKQRLATFGAYPAVSLAEARSRREDLKRTLREGRDPAVVKVAEKAVKAAEAVIAEQTFAVVADQWWDVKVAAENRAASTQVVLRWALDALKAGIGHRPIAEIEPPKLLAVLRKAEAAGKPHKIVRMRGTASKVFRFGIASGLCKRDPATDLKGALTSTASTPHPAATHPGDVGKLMKALDGVEQIKVRLALKLLAVTAVRPGELMSAEWSEIDDAIWDIPAAKAKLRRTHRVPLSKQALKLLAELRKLIGNSKYVFASNRARTGHMHKKSLNDALRDIGWLDRHVPHGFRAMFSTDANESGLWSYDAIELQLAHVDRNSVRRVYNRNEKLQERVRMMNWWANRLDELKAAA